MGTAFKKPPTFEFPQIHARMRLEDWVAARNHDTNWSMPWLCHEVLGYGNCLLQLLDVRSRHPPSEWIPLDLRNVQWARMNGLEAQTFNAGSVILMPGSKQYRYQPRYHWAEGHRLDCLGFPVAKTLLEREVALLRSLNVAVDEIVGKKPKKSIRTGDAVWKKRAKDRFAWEDPKGNPVKLKSDLDGRFLASPMKFDPIEILELAMERRATVESELVLLQTDPNYLRDAVDSLLKLEYYKRKEKRDKWHAISFDLWNDSYRRLEAWDHVHDAAVRLVRVSTPHTLYVIATDSDRSHMSLTVKASSCRHSQDCHCQMSSGGPCPILRLV